MSDRKKIIQMMMNLRESPEAKELAIIQENKLSQTDPEVGAFLRTFHMETDRDTSLEQFLVSPHTQRTVETIKRFCRGNKNLSICEIGGGDGFLSIALVRAGFTNVDLLEPSANYITGTSYLKTRPEAQQVKIFNDLDSWYGSDKRYDILVTNACIHHFQNPGMILSQIRLKCHLNTIWIAFNEFFAIDYADTLNQLLNHRHASLYQLYEFPYSHHLYRALFRSAGFGAQEIETPIPYLQVPVPKVWRINPVVVHLSLGFNYLLRSLRLTWPAYNFTFFLVSRFGRKKIRALDPFFMAFRARPIGWSHVKPDPRFFQSGVLERRESRASVNS